MSKSCRFYTLKINQSGGIWADEDDRGAVLVCVDWTGDTIKYHLPSDREEEH